MSSFASRIVASLIFRSVVLAVIVLAGIVAGLETNQAIMRDHSSLLLALDQIILAIFIAEATLKMAAHGRRPWRYFADGWNIFDFIIVALCALPAGGPFIAVLRLARALRLLRLVSRVPKMQLLVGALLNSLSAMGYVILLLVLLFYIYAVAGIHLFGPTDPDQFGSLSAALFTLFRVVTLDNWSDIFNAQIAHVPAVKVVIYFVSFIVLGTMIILNLFIGIIMNSLSEMHEEIARRQQIARRGAPTLATELQDIEREMDALQGRLRHLQSRSTP